MKRTADPEIRPFSLLVKPAGADCNLRCSYCFYLEKGSLYPDSVIHRMGDEVLERLVSSYMATEQPVHWFGWQGGEPTLMGLDFYRKVVSLQRKYGKPGASVANGLQTNGTLLDDAFAAFFSEYRFLVGVSLDGPEEVHDLFRKDAGGGGTHRRVMRGVRALRRQGTEFNILTLVSTANAKLGKDVYRYLKSEGFFFHQYIPCLETDGQGSLLPWSLEGEDWGRFLLDVFASWHPADTRTVSVRLFDSILEYLVTGRHNVCFMGGSCSSYFVIEHTGDVYPCDFFVRPELKLGNVLTHSWKALADSPSYGRFAAEKANRNAACADCDFLPFCGGDCPKYRAGGRGLSRLCPGWRLCYRETLPEFRRLAAAWIAERGTSHGSRR